MKKDFYFCDLHCHTSVSHDSPAKIENIISFAKKRGVDVIAVTDHNKAYKGPLLINGVHIIPGSEIITADDEHILAYFIREDIQAGLPFKEVVSRVHQQGGFASWAHPMRRGAFQKEEAKERMLLVDCIESGNSMDIEENRTIITKTCDYFSLIKTGGSDTHIEGQVGTGVVRVFEIPTKENFIELLRNGKVIVRDEIKDFRRSNRKLRKPMFFTSKMIRRTKMFFLQKMFNKIVIGSYLKIVNIWLKKIEFNYQDEK
jgi:predicted metal-dependent phosphoesterase TrpH